MTDQVASQLPTGAGRFQDFLWPDPIGGLENGAGASFRSRIGGGIAMPGAVVLFGGGLPAIVGTFGGDAFQVLQAGVGIGSQRLFYPGFPVMLRTSRTPIDGTVDDCAVYRFVITMGCSAAVGANGEMGFQLSQYNAGGGQRIIGDNSPGIGINLPNGTNQVDLLVRGPNGLVTTTLAVPGSAPFPASTFDLRFFSATATADAFWTLRVNGSVIALSAINSSWGAPGTNLPPVASSGGAVGFTPSLVAAGNAATLLTVRSCQLIAAPSELMTL